MYKKLFVILLASAVFLSGCKSKEPAVPVLAEPVGSDMDTAVVTKGDIYELTTYDAKVYPETQEVCFPVNGTVKDIDVYLGQEVQKGDILIRLDDENSKKELAKLEAELEDTKINNEYNNEQQHLDLQILELNIRQKQKEKASEIDIAQMIADYDKAKLERQQTLELQQYEIEKKQDKIDEIKSLMEKNILTAPCAGSVVYIKEIHRKDQISAKDTVIIIADASKLHVQSEFIDANVIKNASQIYAIIKNKEYAIEYIPLTTDEQIKMKNKQGVIESSFSVENDNNIASGDYACICIKDKLKNNVLTIPKNALYSDSEGEFVYRMIDGSIERCNVETGIETDIQVEIKSGLEEGDVVYVQG
ncbi:MAG TPA: efflux RND transporter periplasmic adaptor subunit [Mobilitalea sp.]|nr:efflux RND transporter periplasmic adaptor subunit [Mobilitalea sp.]